MNEADIPIDIHAGKLQEWLVSRRIVQKHWNNGIRDIRDKINNAIKDMPAHEKLYTLLSGAHINYFLCLQIIEILKTTEADSKNVFGRYGSQRMKDWQDVVKLYEKDNIYIAEASQILVRNIQYEIPSLKRQIIKFEQLSDEANKKIQDLIKTENLYRSEHLILCQQLGIKGENVKNELLLKLTELPEMYEKVASNVSLLKKAIDLYSNFTGNIDCLSLLRHISTLGNTTVYHFLYSEAPLSVEEPSIIIDLTENENNVENSEIDFGINFSSEVIDFDTGTDEIKLEVGNIDWGNVDATNLDVSDQIDFNISLEESGIVVEGGGQSGGVAKGNEAYKILDCPVYRDQFLNEILELEAFLKMRLYELSINNNVRLISISLMDGISGNDVDSISEMLSNVEIVFTQFTDQLIQHLHQVKHSAKYVDILSSKLKQKLVAVDKIKLTSVSLKEKSEKFLQQSIELKPMLTRIIEQTKKLQDQIERDISKRYKNRQVNLMGGIHSI